MDWSLRAVHEKIWQQRLGPEEGIEKRREERRGEETQGEEGREEEKRREGKRKGREGDISGVH